MRNFIYINPNLITHLIPYFVKFELFKLIAIAMVLKIEIDYKKKKKKMMSILSSFFNLASQSECSN